MQRIIFDLRGNGGGYLDEAVNIVDLFLPEERMVVFTAGRAFRDTTKYLTSEPALFADEPLVILVNGGSASASEIVAGAVQDWDRGLMLGSTTVGKGSAQQVVNIDEHSELQAHDGRVAHAIGTFHRQAHAQRFHARQRSGDGFSHQDTRTHCARRGRDHPGRGRHDAPGQSAVVAAQRLFSQTISFSTMRASIE